VGVQEQSLAWAVAMEERDSPQVVPVNYRHRAGQRTARLSPSEKNSFNFRRSAAGWSVSAVEIQFGE